MANRHRPSSTDLFTLIELLVVIAIITILASLLLPALNRARMAAFSTVCINNLRQFAVSAFDYADDWNQVTPHNGDPSHTGFYPHLSVTKWHEKLKGDYNFPVESLQCPNTRKDLLPRAFGGGLNREDYQMNTMMGGRSWGPHKPRTMHLSSEKCWIIAGRASIYLGGPNWYIPNDFVTPVPDNGYAPWMWRSTNRFYGLGHPGKGAGTAFGDGHAEIVKDVTIKAMSTTEKNAWRGTSDGNP